MATSARSNIAAYILAAAAMAITYVVAFLWHHVAANDQRVSLELIVPVLFSAWCYGRMPALFAAALSGAALEYNYGTPSAANHLATAMFLGLGATGGYAVAAVKNRFEERLAARARDVDHLSAQLEERQGLADLGLATSKVIHEMANPLNTMSTCVQLIERESAESAADNGSNQEWVQCLRADIASLQNLLLQLRQVGRPLKLDCVPVSLAALLAEILDRGFLAGLAAPVQIVRQVPVDLPPLWADPEKLKQVILNVVKNGVEAMPEGGCLTLRAYALGGHVCFEIEDTGVGIPQEFQVFDLFASSKPEGLGLGLCIARQILAAHRGTIDYTSRPGRGTTFQISLPVAGGDAGARAAVI